MSFLTVAELKSYPVEVIDKMYTGDKKNVLTKKKITTILKKDFQTMTCNNWELKRDLIKDVLKFENEDDDEEMDLSSVSDSDNEAKKDYDEWISDIEEDSI